MSKFRIMKSNKGRYKVQYKRLCFWFDYRYGAYDFAITPHFDTLEDAQRYLKRIEEKEIIEIWRPVDE